MKETQRLFGEVAAGRLRGFTLDRLGPGRFAWRIFLHRPRRRWKALDHD